jgi:PAS domain S-box-containing protein
MERPTQESEDRALNEPAGAGWAEANPATGQFTRVDGRFCEITGYSEAELLGLTFFDITHPEDRERDLEIARPVFCGECDRWQSEKRYVRKDGGVVRVMVSGRLNRDPDGQPLRTVATIQEILDRGAGGQ